MSCNRLWTSPQYSIGGWRECTDPSAVRHRLATNTPPLPNYLHLSHQLSHQGDAFAAICPCGTGSVPGSGLGSGCGWLPAPPGSSKISSSLLPALIYQADSSRRSRSGASVTFLSDAQDRSSARSALRTGTLTNPDEERRATADCCGHAACRHATMWL